jgi:hypothetical protein
MVTSHALNLWERCIKRMNMHVIEHHCMEAHPLSFFPILLVYSQPGYKPKYDLMESKQDVFYTPEDAYDNRTL